ncbi:unnamed protein product [Rhizophagus irregularis]|nr:unnamed protein product [Rhizophagus irregularis]
MTRKRTKKSYPNNNDTQRNTDDSDSDDNNNKRLRPNHEGLDGGSGGGGNGDGRHDEKRESRNVVPAPPKLSVPEIRQSQQETAITNFSSSETAITECILEKYVHAIFIMVYNNLDSFLYNNVMKMLRTLVQRNSIVDTRVSAENLLSRERYSFIPSSLGIFFLIIIN